MARQPEGDYWEWLLSGIINGTAEVGQHDGTYGQDFTVPKRIGVRGDESGEIAEMDPVRAYALGYAMAMVTCDHDR